MIETVDVERSTFGSFCKTSPLASSNVTSTEDDHIIFQVPRDPDTYTPLCIRVDNSSLDKLDQRWRRP